MVRSTGKNLFDGLGDIPRIEFMQKVFEGEMTGKWIGWKVVMYNIEVNNNTAVKMESYLDINNDGKWLKVIDLIDNGGWYARYSDTEFYGAGCDRLKTI